MATQYQQQPGPQPDGGNMGGNEPGSNDRSGRTSVPSVTPGKRSDIDQEENKVHPVRNDENLRTDENEEDTDVLNGNSNT